MDDHLDDLVWADATEQAAAIRDGRASAVALLDAHLERIERYDGTLRSYVALDSERAHDTARAVDDAVRARADLPQFAGVTLSVKDVIDVHGLTTTHSSKVLAGNIAADDDPLVRRCRDAGFVIVGKTNVPEFCTSMTDSELNGTCRNPWDPTRTPGGSSGGAAAAASAALCAVAHGTDGAGSVRSPASFCGLVGVKPTRGLVDFGPELNRPYYGTSVDGVLTRSVRDAAAVLGVFADTVLAPVDITPGPVRVAVTTEAPFGTVTDECAAVARDAGELLRELGHTVRDATPSWDVMVAVAAFPMQVPGPAALVPLDRIDDIEPRNRPLVERLHALTVLEHSAAVRDVRLAATTFLEFWDDHDVLVSPTAGIVAPPVEWAPWDQDPVAHMTTFAGFPNFAQPFNLSGQPALNVPIGCNDAGLPIGVHLAGRRGEEALLLQVARQLEQARPWAHRRPPGFS